VILLTAKVGKLKFIAKANCTPRLDRKISGKVLMPYFFDKAGSRNGKTELFFTDHKHGSVDRKRFIKSGGPQSHGTSRNPAIGNPTQITTAKIAM
jgi:hypothetical protein